MLTNMESQLKEQGAADKLDEVLDEYHAYVKTWGLYPWSHRRRKLSAPRPLLMS